jgi:hypothetical protein
MTQGIRAFTNANFAKYLAERAELGDTGFRRRVMEETVMNFGINIPAAATHYNHSLQAMRLADPKAVEGLGRPVGKKGGRKPVHTVDVIKVKTGEVVVSGISKGAATLLITAAAKAKKAKLAIKVEAPAVETEHVEGVNVEFIGAEAVTA